MQDFGAIPGLARRLLGGAAAAGAGSGGERLRGYSPPAPGQPQAPVKCPRCDSVNTKFCYYNNYNLAQPRHFCKSCRRYWTKGGVLRNVPVGGGCRKSKRSSSARPASAPKELIRRPSSATRSCSGSGSGSSSSTFAAAEASSSASFPMSTLVTPHPDPAPDPTTPFDPPTGMEAPLAQTAEIFADASTAAATGNFTGLIPSPAILGFNSLSDPLPLPLPQQPRAEEEIGAQQGFASNQPCASVGAGCGLAGIDWAGASVDPVLFDLAAAVDPAAAYWSHGHWGDADPALYLP